MSDNFANNPSEELPRIIGGFKLLIWGRYFQSTAPGRLPRVSGEWTLRSQRPTAITVGGGGRSGALLRGGLSASSAIAGMHFGPFARNTYTPNLGHSRNLSPAFGHSPQRLISICPAFSSVNGRARISSRYWNSVTFAAGNGWSSAVGSFAKSPTVLSRLAMARLSGNGYCLICNLFYYWTKRRFSTFTFTGPAMISNTRNKLRTNNWPASHPFPWLVRKFCDIPQETIPRWRSSSLCLLSLSLSSFSEYFTVRLVKPVTLACLAVFLPIVRPLPRCHVPRLRPRSPVHFPLSSVKPGVRYRFSRVTVTAVEY